jgi:hypothetical protein
MNSISSVNNPIFQIPSSKPVQPQAPTPPPDGNIENRKPPAEPKQPVDSRLDSLIGSKIDLSA